MWLLLQGLIMFAVVASNIHWHWTPPTAISPAFLVGSPRYWWLSGWMACVIW